MQQFRSLATKSLTAVFIAAKAATASAGETPEILGLTPTDADYILPTIKVQLPSQLKHGLDILTNEKTNGCIEAYDKAAVISEPAKDFEINLPTETGTITCARLVVTREDRKIALGRDDGNPHNTYAGCRVDYTPGKDDPYPRSTLQIIYNLDQLPKALFDADVNADYYDKEKAFLIEKEKGFNLKEYQDGFVLLPGAKTDLIIMFSPAYKRLKDGVATAKPPRPELEQVGERILELRANCGPGI